MPAAPGGWVHIIAALPDIIAQTIGGAIADRLTRRSDDPDLITGGGGDDALGGSTENDDLLTSGAIAAKGVPIAYVDGRDAAVTLIAGDCDEATQWADAHSLGGAPERDAPWPFGTMNGTPSSLADMGEYPVDWAFRAVEEALWDGVWAGAYGDAAPIGVAEYGSLLLRSVRISGATARVIPALDVTLTDGRSIWEETDIVARGEAWEAFDAARTGFLRTPANFKTFDQFDRVSRVAVSNKTLSHNDIAYSLVDRNALYGRIRDYINAAVPATFDRYTLSGFALRAADISQARVHLLLPAGETLLAHQASQLQRASQYAAQKGVSLQIEYGH
jgi:hypothetical protein